MKSEPSRKHRRNTWIIDENKCLTMDEVKKLKSYCLRIKKHGLRDTKFSPIRNWMMVELGLNAGLRVEEMASLKTSNLIIDSGRSSIVVIGKGEKEKYYTAKVVLQLWNLGFSLPDCQTTFIISLLLT